MYMYNIYKHVPDAPLSKTDGRPSQAPLSRSVQRSSHRLLCPPPPGAQQKWKTVLVKTRNGMHACRVGL